MKLICRCALCHGKLKSIDNASGHYQPTGVGAQFAAERAFSGLGFDTMDRYTEKAWLEDPSLPKGGAWRPVK